MLCAINGLWVREAEAVVILYKQRNVPKPSKFAKGFTLL
jgi:hypothetical protein